MNLLQTNFRRHHLTWLQTRSKAAGNIFVGPGSGVTNPWVLEYRNPGGPQRETPGEQKDINRMKSLSFLDLSYNQLTKLPSALKELPLTRLDLSNNDFSEEERKTIENWFNGKCKIIW